MEYIEKWIKDYIENVDLNKIEWVKLNSNELDNFLEENYYDEQNGEYVHDITTNRLLGMSFLNIQSSKYINFKCSNNDQTYKFLLGIVDNRIGKKTIVGAIVYLNNYLMFPDQDRPFTYISTIEVNSYFRNKGIFKKMCEEFFECINHNQHIVTSEQTEMRIACNVFKTMKGVLINKGFQNSIVENNYHKTHSEIHDMIFSKQSNKVLKRTNDK